MEKKNKMVRCGKVWVTSVKTMPKIFNQSNAVLNKAYQVPRFTFHGHFSLYINQVQLFSKATSWILGAVLKIENICLNSVKDWCQRQTCFPWRHYLNQAWNYSSKCQMLWKTQNSKLYLDILLTILKIYYHLWNKEWLIIHSYLFRAFGVW